MGLQGSEPQTQTWKFVNQLQEERGQAKTGRNILPVTADMNTGQNHFSKTGSDQFAAFSQHFFRRQTPTTTPQIRNNAIATKRVTTVLNLNHGPAPTPFGISPQNINIKLSRNTHRLRPLNSRFFKLLSQPGDQIFFSDIAKKSAKFFNFRNLLRLSHHGTTGQNYLSLGITFKRPSRRLQTLPPGFRRHRTTINNHRFKRLLFNHLPTPPTKLRSQPLTLIEIHLATQGFNQYSW